MKNLTSKISAGTALALLTSAAIAAPSVHYVPSIDPIITGPVPHRVTQLAQADQPNDEKEQRREERRKKRQQAEEAAADEEPAKEQAQPEPEAEPEQAPAPQQAEPAQEAQPAEEAEPAQQAEPAQEAEPAEEPEPSAPQQAAPEVPAEEPAEEQAEPEQPAEEQAEPAEPEQPAEPVEQQAEPEQPAEDQAEPEEQAEPAEQPAEAPRQAQPEQPATEQAPAEQQAEPEQPATEQEPAEEQAQPEQPASEQRATGQPAGEQAQQPATDDAQRAAEQQPERAGEANPEEIAPILDSAKERRQRRETATGEQTEQPAAPEQAAEQPAENVPPPESDAQAQSEEIRNVEIEPVTAEEGRRLDLGDTREERQRARRERRERPRDAEIVRRFDDNRVILEIGGRAVIDSPDYDRIILDNDEVYYEELPRGRTREVIVRPNGVRVVTIRNRYGDIIRRSRILPDNREVVLVYVEDRHYDDARSFRDPGADLPPLVLRIPREEYILEAERVEDPDVYYQFFEQPPVEQIRRTYSIDEVKHSARIRDSVRRVDLDTITFEFGSAEIAESEVDELRGVAEAMQRILEENPAETFLIEGHTDAVGSDLANLALSDRRAEAVASALTNVFDIPPENLVTQGYGEQYLKVDTQDPERENRRVAMRRITPLVAPVASNN